MSNRQAKNELAERWLGLPVQLGEAPFGRTVAGLTDYRGWIVPTDAFRPGESVSSADFGRGVFEMTQLNAVTFTRCRFDNAVFRGAKHTNCLFRECDFERTSFRRCSWGGGRTAYNGCRFEKCVLASSTIVGMEFLNCCFEHNKLHAVFHGTVFENCRFSGRLQSCNFLGGDFSEESKRYLTIRKPGGFYEVDLSAASFESVAFFQGFQFQNVKPPADGLHLVLPRSQCAELIMRFSQDNAVHISEAKILIAGHRLYGEGYTIVSRSDLARHFGEEAGRMCFDQIAQQVSSNSRA